MNLQLAEGALISNVDKGSPAERAGLARGDVLTEVDGRKILNATDWEDFVWTTRSGNSFEVAFLRKKDLQRVSILAAEPPANRRGQEGKLGIFVTDLTPELARQIGIDISRGVVVTEVKPNSTAGLIGVEEGDVILEINKSEVSSAAEYERQMKRLKKGQKVVLLLARRGDLFYITAQV
jgi:serine protease Do